MQDFITSLNLNDVQSFMMSHEPPVFVQLLVLLVLFVALYVIRKIRKNKHQEIDTTHSMQWLVAFAIVGVFLEDYWLPSVADAVLLITNAFGRTFY